MAIPERVPISYEPDYHTDTIGRYDDGQFFGWVTATVELSAASGSDWYRAKQWYAVLDAHGAHAATPDPNPGRCRRRGR